MLPLARHARLPIEPGGIHGRAGSESESFAQGAGDRRNRQAGQIIRHADPWRNTHRLWLGAGICQAGCSCSGRTWTQRESEDDKHDQPRHRQANTAPCDD